MSYTPTIGLEIHAELKTRTKMFCASKNDPDETRPNVNICPVCMAHPGTLPVVNREAVTHVLRVGAAVEGVLADYTEFDRKNYFYPDLPKGYQISQYEYPLVSGGTLNGIQLTRIHLEEDTARSQHSDAGHSIVDFNRAGVPLMELVTEPVIHDATVARAFAEELQRLLRTLGAGEANMEKGEMRVEANISVSKEVGKLGTKVEVKNLNSFKAVERAILYEIDRQTELLESGGAVVQETRGWNENKEETFSQRKKESSHDYRYFPDPDIPKFKLSKIAELKRETLLSALPELPWKKRERLVASGMTSTEADVLIADEVYSSLYDHEIEPITDQKAKKAARNVLLSDIRGKNPPQEKLLRLKGALHKATLLFVEGKLSSTGLKAALDEVLERGGDVESIAATKGLLQIEDTALLEKIAGEVIAANEKVVADVKGGKIEAMKFLVGQGMKLSKGSANPALLEQVFKEKIQVPDSKNQ